jgi:hypothetical protein
MEDKPTYKPTNPKDAVGIKKAPLHVVPAVVLAELGVGMAEGALKYGPYNWRKAGVRASVYYDATMRHLMRWWEGEDTDPDSGLSHVTKAICSLVVLRDAMIQGMVTDDRACSLHSGAVMHELDAHTAHLIEKYKDTNTKQI